MPFDWIMFGEATPGTGNVNLAACLADTLYQYTGDDIILRPEITSLLAVQYAAETTPGHCRVTQPGMAIPHQFTASVDINTQNAPGFNDFMVNPLPLKGNLKLNAISTNATDEDSFIACMIGDGPFPFNHYVSPDIIIRGISDTTVTAFTWTAVPVTWDFDPAPGKYQIVYLRVGSYLATNLHGVARLTNLKETTWRPGVPTECCSGDKIEMFTTSAAPRWAYWPSMNGITCTHEQLPNLEVCQAGAATDFLVNMGLKKIG